MAILPRPVRPRAAIADLVALLRERQRHQWAILGLSVALSLGIVWLFVGQFNVKREYVPPEVTYVTQFEPDRSRAEIVAQQAKDLPAQQARLKAEADAEAKRRESFRRVAKMMGVE